MPVHALLGGQVRDHIKRVFAGSAATARPTVANGRPRCVARGFTAVKMNGTEEMQIVDSHDKVEAAIANVAADARGGRHRTSASASTSTAASHSPMAKVLLQRTRAATS